MKRLYVDSRWPTSVKEELDVFAKMKAPLELYDIGKGSLKSYHAACTHN